MSVTLVMATTGIIVNGAALAGPNGVSIKNFTDPSVYRFVNAKRSGAITEVVVHETVTRSWQSTVEVLQPASPTNPGGRGLGVHFIADHDGTIYQHGDLATDMLWHASQHNGPSVGIETVNPYEPNLAPTNGPWKDVIDNAPWAAGGKYLVPTPEQSESVFQLILWMLTPDSTLSIPLTFRGLNGNTLLMGPYDPCKNLAPGIYAHHYFGHADGAWLNLYIFLRTQGMDPATARSTAIQLATGAHSAGVDVSPYLAPTPPPNS
jgi:hypothetical protein